MNGKTAKLLHRYALKQGTNVNDLKKQWLSMNAGQRFARRQEILKELKGDR